MQHEITRAFHIDVGHRVYGHESKCAHLHGHRYVIFVTLRTTHLDSLGRVVDFGDMKDTIGTWLDRNWDHGLVLFEADPFVELFACPPHQSPVEDKQSALVANLAKQKLFILPANPTAENLARYLVDEVIPELCLPGIHCTRVTVQETPNCSASADATPGPDDVTDPNA